jgi:hypothetical protein
MPNTDASTARLATLSQLRETTVPSFVSPVPSNETLRDWFDAAGIPRFKSNPAAQRGGGPCFYSVPAVERFFRLRTMVKRVPRRGGASV